MALPVFDGRELGAKFELLRVGQTGSLTGEAAHHAGTVRRLNPGELFDLVDGAGLRLTCTVSAAESSKRGTKTGLNFQVVAREEENMRLPRLGLVQALAKAGRDEQSVEAAVELDVDFVLPWAADRCIVQWKGKKARSGAKKWENLLVAAAKQARRSRWPKLLELHTTAQLGNLIAREDGHSLFIVLEADSRTGITEVLREVRGLLAEPSPAADRSLRSLPGQGAEPNKIGGTGAGQTATESALENIYVAVGPEGGIAPTELDTLTAAGAKLCRLGPTILRSSSAAPAALAAIAASLELWEKSWAQKTGQVKEHNGS